MDFLTLVNLRLDDVKKRLSKDHYKDTLYHAKRWVQYCSGFTCSEITHELITRIRDKRSNISNHTANKELRMLRSLFSWGVKKKYITNNPATCVDMLQVTKSKIFVPSQSDISKVLKRATDEQRFYLLCLRDTLARSREINQLTWDDIDFENRQITLYTRKKRYGTLTPRIIPLTNRLNDILQEKYFQRDKDIRWVFWHRFYSKKTNSFVIGPYTDRKRFMKTLCKQAGVKYFRFHPIRHAGASFMENIGIQIVTIQSILGHENRRTTEIYIHSNDSNNFAAMSLYENSSNPKQY
jgi:integrase